MNEAELQAQLQAARNAAALAQRQRVAGVPGWNKPIAIGQSVPSGTETTPEMMADNVKLSNGDWVSKDAFYKLSEEDQSRLMQLGIQGFNNYYAQKDVDFKTSNTQLKDGTWVSNEFYSPLSSDDKILLNNKGVDAFNKQKAVEFETFKAANVQVGSKGEWIAKEDYNKLPADWQNRISGLGVSDFQSWLKGAYGGATEYVIVDGHVYGTTQSIPNYPYNQTPNIALDEGGNRIYVGGRWPTAVTRAGTGAEALSGRWPKSVATMQPITPLTHVQVGISIGATAEWVTKEEYKAVGEQSTVGQEILKKEGITAYAKWNESQQPIVEKQQAEKLMADYIKLPDEQLILKTDFEQLSSDYQKLIKEKGYDAYMVEVKKNTVELKSGELINKIDFEALPIKMQQAAMEGGLDAIDISKLKPSSQFDYMKSWDMIDKDAQFAGVDENGQILVQTKAEAAQQVKPEVWYKKLMTADFAKGAAIGMIPIAGTMYFWKTMKPWERGLSIALDVATLIPIVGGISVGVRAGKGVAASVGRVLLSEVKAPITMLMRPGETIKSMVRPVKTLLAAKRVPVAAAEIRSFILKIPDGVVRDIGDAKSAMAARDVLTEAAIRGQKPVIQIGGKQIELAQVAIQQKLEAAAIHNAPDVRAFLNGTVVKEGGEGLGLFVEPYLNTRLTQADAFGRGFTPSVDIGALEWTGRHVRKIGKYAPQEIAMMDTAPVRSLNLADASSIPADIAPVLHSYIAKEKGTIVGSFTEWLKLDNAPRPHDIDLNFANPAKAREDIANLCRSKGYETQVKQSAVLIKNRQGKIVEIGNIKGARESFFSQHGIPVVPTKLVDGVQVIPLGEQYLRQGFGALGAGEDIATFKKRTEHMLRASKKLRTLVAEAGLSERMPGAIVIRDEKVLRAMRPSDKLYRGTLEIESTIKPLTELPPPSQILKMYDSTGQTINLLIIGKPFTPAQIAKMKIMGAVDTIRDIFRPAMKIDGKAVEAMDEVSNLASEARSLRKRIGLAKAEGKTVDEIAELNSALSQINSRARAVGRNIDSMYAARTSLRPIAISVEDFLDRISYREVARQKPQELARALVGMPRAERVQVLNELDRPTRARIETEISRVPALRAEAPHMEFPRATIPRAISPRKEVRAEIPRTEVPRLTRVAPERIPERVPERVPERITERMPTRVTERVPTRVPERIPGRVPQRIPGKVPERVPIIPPKITTTIIELPDGKKLELTQAQTIGSIAWKQGKLKVKGGKLKPLYIMKYPDESGQYPVKNTIYTFDPIEGVKYAEGIGSVAKSIIKKYGEIPIDLKFDMGIQDVEISKDKTSGIQKPKIKFRLDPRFQRHYRKQVETTPSLGGMR